MGCSKRPCHHRRQFPPLRPPAASNHLPQTIFEADSQKKDTPVRKAVFDTFRSWPLLGSRPPLISRPLVLFELTPCNRVLQSQSADFASLCFLIFPTNEVVCFFVLAKLSLSEVGLPHYTSCVSFPRRDDWHHKYQSRCVDTIARRFFPPQDLGLPVRPSSSQE